MPKRPNLTEAMQVANGQINQALTSVTESLPPKGPASRTGQKLIAGHFDPAVSKQLRQIALDENTTVQELLREAINDLFMKKGKANIA